MIDQKQLDSVEYFNCLGSVITNNARCTGKRDITCRIVMEKSIIQQQVDFFTGKLHRNLRKTLEQCYNWSIALYGAETGTFLKAEQKCL